MIDTIYIEEAVFQHPRSQEILSRFPKARRIEINKYGEVFNPKGQNFRLQKNNPALILANKHNQHALPAPEEYGIGSDNNYYFSHMLNCLYDCRYCFLQGMYRSANYILFVNYEDFQQEIKTIAKSNPDQDSWFFSGYDCDSLALEPVTNFAKEFLPFFSTLKGANLELRSKSTQIRSLLKTDPFEHCVVAFSISPQEIIESVEVKTPSLQKRIDAMQKLQQHGWQVGLRFDPVIYQQNYQQQYRSMFKLVFEALEIERIHSVSLGTFRLPKGYFRTVQRLYPDEALLQGPLETTQGMTGYQSDLETEMRSFCEYEILRHCPKERFFPCY